MIGQGGLNSTSPRVGEGVRANWREIPVVDLTDAEVDLMTDQEANWCGKLLVERKQKLAAAQVLPAAEQVVPAEPLNIDAAEIAVMDSGIRILVYPGEGHDDQSFAGEILNPTERDMRGHGHVSCLWDRSKVVAVEGSA